MADKRLTLLAALIGASVAHAQEDPRLWLEEVMGERALDWVRAQNEVSTGELTSDPLFEPLRERLLAALDSDDRIPYAAMRGGYLYNFWRDAGNPRGLWRRTTLESYRQAEPA